MRILLATLLCVTSAIAFSSDKTFHHASHEGDHDHVHGPDCGHTAEYHDGHIDYEHNGHHHHWHAGHWHECTGPHTAEELNLSAEQVQSLVEQHGDGHHETLTDHDHVHGFGCGHEAVLHEDHVDYIHGDHAHHYHGGHWHECDLEVK